MNLNDCRLFYLLKVCVWFVRVEDFVAVHHCHEIFSFREVDDVVGVAWKHVDCFYLVTAYLKI